MKRAPLSDAKTRESLWFWLPLALFLLLSLALNHSYLGGGFQADDLFALNMLRQQPLPFSHWRGMWSVAIDQFPGFTNLWWFEPGVQGSFFRPLPSLVIEGSYHLFGENAFPLHLLSILLHGLVAFTAFRLFARLTGQSLIALLAGLVFITCEDHSLGVGWIAAMTDLMCVVFINLALLAHLTWRQNGRWPFLAGSLLGQALALASKESAVAAPLAIMLLEWFLTRSEQVAGRSRSTALLCSARRWWPSAVLLLAFLLLYKALGFGAMRTLMYLDPTTQPWLYLRHAATALPVMFSAALTVISPGLATFTPEFLLPLALLGAVLAALFLWGLWPLRREPVAAWALALFVVALLPQVATEPSERLLYLPFVPASYLLARLLAAIAPLARWLRPGEPLLPRATRIWGWYVLAGLLLPAAIISAVEPRTFAAIMRKPERDALTSLVVVRAHVAAHPAASVVILNTSGPFLTIYAGGIYEYHLRRAVPTYVLSGLNGKLTLERVGPRSLLLTTDRRGWLSNMFARIVRINPHLVAGRVYHSRLFNATLIRLTPDRQDALAVRFDFQRPLDDPNLLFLTWDGQRFLPLEAAELQLGRQLLLADTSDVWASMM